MEAQLMDERIRKALEAITLVRRWQNLDARWRQVVTPPTPQERALARFARCGIPALAAAQLGTGVSLSGDPLVTPSFGDKLFEVLSGGDLLVVLLGTVGTGKTIAASRWISAIEGGRFVSARLAAALADWGEDADEFEGFIGVPSLVLDEVGLEPDSRVDRFVALVEQRFEDGKQTLLVGNLTPLEFDSRYGERIARRVRASGARIVAEEVICSGEHKRIVAH